MPASRRQRLALVDDDRLVGAVAARRDDGEAELGEQQMVERRIGQHRADAAGFAARQIRRGRCRVASDEHDRPLRRGEQRAPRRRRRRHSASTAASEGNMTAKGFSSRSLRARSRRTAASFRASTMRWKPPRPFTATMAPSRIAAAAAMSAASPVVEADGRRRPTARAAARRPGRRSARRGNAGRAGSRIPREQASHIGKRRIDVRARS